MDNMQKLLLASVSHVENVFIAALSKTNQNTTHHTPTAAVCGLVGKLKVVWTGWKTKSPYLRGQRVYREEGKKQRLVQQTSVEICRHRGAKQD